MFNSCLIMNMCTYFVSLMIIFILKYLVYYGIKICHKITYYLTIHKPRMILIAGFTQSIKPKPSDGSNFKRW
jgi:hypothetical protein